MTSFDLGARTTYFIWSLFYFMDSLQRRPGIYCIYNVITKKYYIGYSINIKKRIIEHLSALSNNRHDNDYLQKSFNKYGKSSFEFDVIEYCEIEFLCSNEHYWCTILNVHNRNYGYNISPTNPYTKSSSHSLETAKKISNSKKGIAPRKNFNHSSSTIEKMKNSSMKKVKCLDSGIILESHQEAADFFGVCVGTIYNVLNKVTSNNWINIIKYEE